MCVYVFSVSRITENVVEFWWNFQDILELAKGVINQILEEIEECMPQQMNIFWFYIIFRLLAIATNYNIQLKRNRVNLRSSSYYHYHLLHWRWYCNDRRLSVCLFVNRIIKNIEDEFWWNFQNMWELAQGGSNLILGLIRERIPLSFSIFWIF